MIEVIEEPYDDNERQMIEIIERIFREARERADPYMKALAFSRSLKMPRYIVSGDDLKLVGGVPRASQTDAG